MPERRKLGILNRLCLSMVKTPCFIYDVETIGKRIEIIKAAFNDTSYTQYYPAKANPCPDIVHYCIENGLGLDACSMGDLEIAKIFNIQPEKISFTGVGLTEQDMRILYGKKIIPNLGSVEEIKRWARLFPGSQIGIRVSVLNPDISIQEQYSIKMGVFPGDWPNLRDTVLQYNLEIVKIHRHESKNSICHEELMRAFSNSFEGIPGWAWENVKTINFGGGWGLPYSRKGQLDVEKLIQGIIAITRKMIDRTMSGSLKIEIEPGEFLVGECGYLYTHVVDVRNLSYLNKKENLQVVVLDTPFPITSGYRKPELLYNVDFDLDNKEQQKETFFTIIYGRGNTTMDSINKGTYLPGINMGTAALVKCVGAYVPVLMSYFNQQDIPAEFLLKNGALVKSRDCLGFKFHYRHAYLKGEDNERI